MAHRCYSIRRLIPACFCMLMMFSSYRVCGQASTESELKAVFVFNFTNFVQWPSTAFQDERSPFVVGVLGAHTFGNTLDETMRGENVNGHPIKVEYYKSPEDVKRCHILYIGMVSKHDIASLVGRVGKETLTLSDNERFNAFGGMFRFYKHENRLRLAANKAAIDSSRLTVSSKLLRLTTMEDK